MRTTVPSESRLVVQVRVQALHKVLSIRAQWCHAACDLGYTGSQQ